MGEIFVQNNKRWRTPRKNAVMFWKASAVFITTAHSHGKQNLSTEERLHFHRKHSAPLMEALHEWSEAPFTDKKPSRSPGAETFWG
jgi:hypothetical protein